MKNWLLFLGSLLMPFGSAYAETKMCPATYFGFSFYASGINSTKNMVFCLYSENINENLPPINSIYMEFGNFEPSGENWLNHQNFFVISDGDICQNSDPSNCPFMSIDTMAGSGL